MYLQLLDILYLHHYEIIDVSKRPGLIEYNVHYNVSYYAQLWANTAGTLSMFLPSPWILFCFVLNYSPSSTLFLAKTVIESGL